MQPENSNKLEINFYYSLLDLILFKLKTKFADLFCLCKFNQVKRKLKINKTVYWFFNLANKLLFLVLNIYGCISLKVSSEMKQTMLISLTQNTLKPILIETWFQKSQNKVSALPNRETDFRIYFDYLPLETDRMR